MSEETQKTSRTRKIIRVLFAVCKWLFVAALSLLLIGGLYFHGPWKVLTLIAIILATLTIVPKPFRKWVWTCFAITIAVLVVWVFLPEDNEGWKPYTLNEERVQLEAKYALADKDNAALIYDRLIEAYDANDFNPEFMDDDLEDLTRTQPWSTKDYPQMAEWLKGHEETIVTLTEAVAKEKCHFEIHAGLTLFRSDFDRLRAMKNYGMLLIRAGNNDLGNGHIYESIKKYVTAFQIARHQCQQPSMMDILVGISLEAMSMVQFGETIINYNLTEGQLDLINSKLAENEYNWSSDFSRILECENLFAKNTILGVLYEVDSDGNTRFTRNLMTTIMYQLAFIPPSERNLLPDYWRKKAFKARTISVWLVMPTDPQKAAEIIDDAQKDQYEITEDDFDWGKEPEPFSYWSMRVNFSGMIKMQNIIMAPAHRSVHKYYIRTISMNQATRIIVALKRYEKANGAWPGKLEDIKEQANENLFVDPINGADYVYKLTDENFTLYSTGQNSIDEDGDRGTEKPDETKTDDILYWPRKQRKPQMLMPGAPDK